jgi:ribosomal protein S18 acetylase RimI-like enzyme
MLGVRPDSRQKGVGRSVLGWGLARLKETGLKRAILTVDRLNPPALALYRRAGFEEESETIWYERGLISGPEETSGS